MVVPSFVIPLPSTHYEQPLVTELNPRDTGYSQLLILPLHSTPLGCQTPSVAWVQTPFARRSSLVARQLVQRYGFLWPKLNEMAVNTSLFQFTSEAGILSALAVLILFVMMIVSQWISSLSHIVQCTLAKPAAPLPEPSTKRMAAHQVTFGSLHGMTV